MNLVGIQPEHAATVWPMVRGWIAAALERDGRLYPESVLSDLLASTAQLWVVWSNDEMHGAVVTQRIEYPRCTELQVLAVGGRRLHEWFGMGLGVLEQFARDRGCTRLVGYGRQGWGRLMPDYEQAFVAYRKELV